LAGIFETFQKAFDSPTWTLKIQASRVIKSLGNSVDGKRLVPYFSRALDNGFLKCLRGRYFQGKEEIVTATAEFIKVSNFYFKTNTEETEKKAKEIVTQILNECQKKN